MIDKYGRRITVETVDGLVTYSTGGISITMPESSSTSSVVQAIEAMAPPEYVDRESMVVTRFQARAALLNAGLLDTVNTAMQSAQPVAQLEIGRAHV